MTNENEVKDVQPEVEDIQVVVNDSEEDQAAAPQEDELENYSKKVSKRINKLNARNRATEERAAQLEAALNQRNQEVQAIYQQVDQTQSELLAKEEENVAAKEREADDLYKRAHASGDAELMSKADTLKSDLSIQKEKVRLARQKREQQPAQTNVAQPQYQEQQNNQPQPTREAQEWAKTNKWFGSEAAPTQYAQFTHVNLIQEGYEPDSEEYYEELNTRVYKVYPDLESGKVEESEDRPAVQRVASASVGSRQKTQGNKNGVSFSKAEIERNRGLKPHGMSEDAWLKSVAKQKLLISQREVK
jgi:hypothetical protein|tara:strand:- start:49 stop:957 length:909 start_codon:yes stop_codon:yes gene_type:complete